MIAKLNVATKILDYAAFASGMTYFLRGHRMFAGDNPCESCVIVHNNWIVSFQSKRYRFKEHMMWHVDTNGYYSNSTAKYIWYENTLTFDNGRRNISQQDLAHIMAEERKALQNALFLGHLLQRFVILPKFTCGNLAEYDGQPKCAAHIHYDVRLLDQHFEDQYREHVFLQNPQVPRTVVHSQSPTLTMPFRSNLPTNAGIKPNSCSRDKCIPLTISHHGTTQEGVLLQLKPYAQYSVLKFHHLFGSNFDKIIPPTFRKHLDVGVTCQSCRTR